MTTDNRTNEPTEARVEAACEAYQAAQNEDPYDFKGRMSAALAAADAVVTVEMVADEIANAWDGHEINVREAARAVSALFGEVAGDE